MKVEVQLNWHTMDERCPVKWRSSQLVIFLQTDGVLPICFIQMDDGAWYGDGFDVGEIDPFDTSEFEFSAWAVLEFPRALEDGIAKLENNGS